jgi:hypothetical protein
MGMVISITSAEQSQGVEQCARDNYKEWNGTQENTTKLLFCRLDTR